MSFGSVPPDPARLTLASRCLSLELAPEIGGSIARLDWIGDGAAVPLMRPADSDDVLAMACFPLVPYANRIRGSAFECNGRRIALTPNMTGDPSAIHGQGWLAPWQVEAASADEARIGFVHEPGEWPWHYAAWQAFRLEADALIVTLGCRNLSDAAMPCALGLHPYFPLTMDTRLQAKVAGVLTVDRNLLPVERVPATGRYDLADRAIYRVGLDNGYDGWDGAARIVWPDRALTLTMTTSDARYFQVYAPTDADIAAIEPVQQENDAFAAPQADWRSKGVTMLALGEARSMTCRFAIERLGPR